MTPRGDAEVILVGAELLKGERGDTHLAWLGRALARHGLRVDSASVVGDDVDAIAGAVRGCLGRARVVVVTGGLGPTPDDVTREGVARALDAGLVFDAAAWEEIAAYFAARGYTPTDANRRQAMFPRGADVLGNTRGTAPGFAVDAKGTTVFVVPGPPHEMQRMFERDIASRLEAIVGRPALRVETFRTFGIGESQIMERFGGVLDAVTQFDVSSLPWITGVDVVLTQRRDAVASALDDEAARVEKALRDGLGTKLYEHGERTLAAVVGEALTRRGDTLAVAESLTGGMIGTAFTDNAGSSAYVLADVVAYSNASKTAFLGVDEDTVAREGAVSEAVCRQMAEGIRRRCGATWGLSTTGIAGPAGGSEEKPVGLVFIGLAWDDGADVVRRVFTGGRGVVRAKSAYGAIWMLYDRLARSTRRHSEEA